MKTLRISDDLRLPLDWIQLATVVYGARGAGKTSFGRVAAEEATKARQRFCAIDLKGDWYGLKSSADGKNDGIPVVVFGGDHEDVPLEEGSGAFVGETVAGLEQSCILDFENFSKGKRTRFLGEFFEALYHRNREPLLLLLDESQSYAPQKPGPDEARTLGAVQDLVKLGRKHGIGPVLFTQRGAGLNKEVSELCDLLVAFRTPGPLDQDRIKDWLDANATKAERESIMGKLAGLDTGTAVFASGHPSLKLFGVHSVRRPETFDSSATPKVGERKKEPKRLATPDLEALRTKMAEAIERKKADDPKALRATIAELRRELANAPAITKIVEVPVPAPIDWKWLNRELNASLEACATRIENALVDSEVMHDGKGRRADAVASSQFDDVVPVAPISPQSREVGSPKAAKSVPKPVVNSSQNGPEDASGGGFPMYGKNYIPRAGSPAPGDPSVGNGGLRRILIALAQRQRGLTKRQIGLRAGLSSSSGTFSTYMGKARSAGWITGFGEIVAITPAGLAALGPYTPLPEGRALLAYWLGELGSSGASRMLQAIADVYPNHADPEDIGYKAKISHTSGTFSTYLGKLRGLELVTGTSRNLQLSTELAE